MNLSFQKKPPSTIEANLCIDLALLQSKRRISTFTTTFFPIMNAGRSKTYSIMDISRDSTVDHLQMKLNTYLNVRIVLTVLMTDMHHNVAQIALELK